MQQPRRAGNEERTEHSRGDERAPLPERERVQVH
jgi:hypothetical protein